jgi:hypothetical protein
MNFRVGRGGRGAFRRKWFEQEQEEHEEKRYQYCAGAGPAKAGYAGIGGNRRDRSRMSSYSWASCSLLG